MKSSPRNRRASEIRWRQTAGASLFSWHVYKTFRLCELFSLSVLLSACLRSSAMIFESCDTCNYQSAHKRCVIVSGQCWQCCSLRQSENPIRAAYSVCERCCYECVRVLCAASQSQRVSRGCMNTFTKSAGNQIWLSGGSAFAWLGSVARVERPNEKACGPVGRRARRGRKVSGKRTPAMTSTCQLASKKLP